jgi:hypothetical protein
MAAEKFITTPKESADATIRKLNAIAWSNEKPTDIVLRVRALLRPHRTTAKKGK